MSKRPRKSTKEQQRSRDDSQIQSPEAKRSKLESKQPTNIEFQLPDLLDLSILSPNHFKVFGKQGKAPGGFLSPISITQQRTTGRYFISECDNHRIQVLDENFTHQMFYEKKGSDIGQLKGPKGMCFDRKSNLVICEYDNNRLQVISTTTHPLIN